MAIFKTLRNADNSEIEVKTSRLSLLFDHHSSIYGKNFRFASFEYPQKPLKFIVRQVKNIDAVFVTNSRSIGVLFLKNIKIYITRPVFEQILLRYEQLKSLIFHYDEIDNDEIVNNLKSPSNEEYLDKTIDISDIDNINNDQANNLKYPSNEEYLDKIINISDITYDKIINISDIDAINNNKITNDQIVDNLYKIVKISDINIDKFKKNVVFIKYNQNIQLGDYEIQSISSGTFIGWCNFLLKFPNHQSLLLITSYSHKKRFSVQSPTVKTDFLLINRKYDDRPGSVDELTSCIKNYITDQSSSIKPLLIPIDLPTFFIEILFHTLSIADLTNIPITIVSEFFNKLDLLLNVHSEWLNNSFFSVPEPFPVRKYSNLKIIQSLKDIENIKNIVFCAQEQYEMLKNRINGCFEVLLINYGADVFPINSIHINNQKTNSIASLPGIEEYSDRSLMNYSKSITLKIESTDQEILNRNNGILIKDNCFYINTESNNDSIVVDSLLPVINNRVVLWGNLIISDFESSNKIIKQLNDEKLFIKKLMEAESPIYINGWFVFTTKRIKFRMMNENQIECLYF